MLFGFHLWVFCQKGISTWARTKDGLLLVLCWVLKHDALLPCSALGERCAMGGFPQHWLSRVRNNIQLPWALATLFDSKNAHSEERNPVCGGIAETCRLSEERCFVRGVGQEAGQCCWTWCESSGWDALERSWGRWRGAGDGGADKACWDLHWLGTVPGGRLLPCREGSAFPLFPGLLTLSRPI